MGADPSGKAETFSGPAATHTTGQLRIATLGLVTRTRVEGRDDEEPEPGEIAEQFAGP